MVGRDIHTGEREEGRPIGGGYRLDGRVFLRRNNLQVQEASAHVEDHRNHAWEIHSWIGSGYLACAGRGIEALWTHLARALPIPRLQDLCRQRYQRWLQAKGVL